MRMAAVWWLLGLALLTSCTRVEPAVDPGAGSPPELGSSLNVRVMDDSVQLEIHITNTTSGPVALEFNTSQRYDFEVDRVEGERVWRWSDDMMFGQVLGREELAPGESRRWTANWPASGREGEYVATARVVSNNLPVELRTLFRLPAE